MILNNSYVVEESESEMKVSSIVKFICGLGDSIHVICGLIGVSDWLVKER